MPEPASVIVDETSADPLALLRLRVLRTALAILAFAVPGISVVILLGSLRSGGPNGDTIVLSAYTLTFPLLWLGRNRVSFRLTAVMLLGLMAVTAFLVETRGGVAAGNVLLDALVLSLGALFFGRRGAMIAWVAVVGLCALAGFLVVSHMVSTLDLAMWDPTRTRFWVRETVALALVATAVALVPLYVIERLSAEAERFRKLALSEREQLAALARAEHEREQERERRLEALQALEESRKIEALARLAGGIAHDFNNALTVVMGAAGEIAKRAASDEEGAHARAILEEAQRGAELTRELLLLGKGQVSQPRPVSLEALLGRLGPTFRRLLPGDINLDVEVPSELPAVLVDPVGLERALLNLVLNARDAMPTGGDLRVRCFPGTGAEHITLAVSDTGVGMTPDIQERIFEPFFTTKAPGLGTGLGLATVRAFATEAGGDIRVSSSSGAGATFTLRLPVSPDPAPDHEEGAAGTSADLPQPAGAHVLLVEDHETVRTSMARALVRGGFRVTEAEDGDRALALLGGQEQFSLLCIDGVIPGAHTGAVIEFAEGHRPDMHVLLCSGYLPEDLLRRGVRAGRYAYLQKPFSPDELLAAVHGVLAAPRTPAA